MKKWCRLLKCWKCGHVWWEIASKPVNKLKCKCGQKAEKKGAKAILESLSVELR